MAKPFLEETYDYNGIKAYIQIFKERSVFQGSWSCKVCSESNGYMGISNSLEVTLRNSRSGFEKHADQRHP